MDAITPKKSTNNTFDRRNTFHFSIPTLKFGVKILEAYHSCHLTAAAENLIVEKALYDFTTMKSVSEKHSGHYSTKNMFGSFGLKIKIFGDKRPDLTSTATQQSLWARAARKRAGWIPSRHQPSRKTKDAGKNMFQ